jgi:hypothetical protein
MTTPVVTTDQTYALGAVAWAATTAATIIMKRSIWGILGWPMLASYGVVYLVDAALGGGQVMAQLTQAEKDAISASLPPSATESSS